MNEMNLQIVSGSKDELIITLIFGFDRESIKRMEQFDNQNFCQNPSAFSINSSMGTKHPCLDQTNC